MIYVFNKNKILSYVLASSFVLMLFAFHDNIIPKEDVKLIKVSSNVEENNSNLDISNEIDNIYNSQ